jgi:hypothetical protein
VLLAAPAVLVCDPVVDFVAVPLAAGFFGVAAVDGCCCVLAGCWASAAPHHATARNAKTADFFRIQAFSHACCHSQNRSCGSFLPGANITLTRGKRCHNVAP